MNDFLLAFLAGNLLGLSVVGYLYLQGRVAGISGLIAQIIKPKTSSNTTSKKPALYFILGIVIVPFFFKSQFSPMIELNTAPWVLILAGLIVGIGVRMGSGCTSGHGICGISRLSKRSMIATLCFMTTGMMTVYVIRHVIGAEI